jgi:uncharacterized membrane protein YjjP (DUF1212 family)
MPERSREQDEASALLLDLTQALHGVALPADQVEDQVQAVARAMGQKAELFTLQSFAAAELGTDGGRHVDIRRFDFETHWNLRRMHDLLDLSDAAAKGRIGVAEARRAIPAIVSRPNPYPRWLVVLCYGAYGAAVAARIGGGWIELLVAGAIGLLTGGIHFGALRSHRVDLLKSLLASFCGSLATLTLSLVLPPFALGPAMFGGIVLLVPATVLTIAIHELANEALESGVVRLAYGLLRFLMLAFGMAGALAIWRVLSPMPVSTPPTALPQAVTLAILTIGALALMVCLQGRPRDAPWIVAAVLVAYGTQRLSKLVAGDVGSPFVTAFVLGAVAHLHARLPGHTAATMIVPGLLQIGPGFLGTEAAFHLLEGERGGASGSETFGRVLLVALQLGTGLLVASLVFSRRRLAEARTP